MRIFEHLNKGAVIGFGGVFILLLILFFYSLAGRGYEDEGPLTVLPASPLDASLGRELLAALAKLKSTKLDTSIFDDPVFASLKDFGVEIAAQPVGRRNPFAAFGSTPKTQSGTIKPPTASGPAKKTPLATPPKQPSGGGFDVE